jgi:hypothetical protein
LERAMKSTKRIKVKNGIEYWYEETPYYDKEKKQIRHKSKYLGRNVDGQPVKMRSAAYEVKEMMKTKSMSIKSSFDYGSIFVLQSIMAELKIDRYLENLFLNEYPAACNLELITGTLSTLKRVCGGRDPAPVY